MPDGQVEDYRVVAAAPAICWRAAAIAVLTACSDRTAGDDPDGRHDRSSLPALIGEQIYACDDGSNMMPTFLPTV
jgi:hypothetical protein